MEPDNIPFSNVGTDSGLETSMVEVLSIMRRMKEFSAKGLDSMSMRMMSCLDEYAAMLAKKINEIFKGAPIPASWNSARIALLPKDGVEKTDISRRRPITITTLTYRVFMKVFTRRMQMFIEGGGLIGE